MKYAIGIDLGTTNTEMAFCSLNDGSVKPVAFEIPQFIAPSTVEARLQLPSFLYIGKAEEQSLANWKLPWDSVEEILLEAKSSSENSSNTVTNKKENFFKRLWNRKEHTTSNEKYANQDSFYLTGEIASARSSNAPEQVVTSAKSWLTCSRIDRRAPILPWNASNDYTKVSPVEASRQYLTHIVSAWNHVFSEAPIFDQQVVITVPASFDESARELTYEAAIQAGLNPETLLFLEEPQAALYAWLAHKGEDWRKDLKVGDVIFVCDVGGGTTDLSLIRVEEEDGNFVLNRLAVGNRLLLGGDNIDLALAYHATDIFASNGQELSSWQTMALQRQCRTAKESLLSEQNHEDSCKIAILGRSSHLLKEAVSIDFPKQDAVSIVLDGFFPECSLDDKPRLRSKIGVREIGLPYEPDPSITKHIAKFLKSCVNDHNEVISPNYFIFNGGVFKSKLIKDRLIEQLSNWFPLNPPKDLHPKADLDNSVSKGAAYYGSIKKNGGIRIRAASARSYYIGIESTGLAIPGVSRPLKALCIVPFGMEEGTECVIPANQLELVIGEPVMFRFFSSTTRTNDRPGVMLNWSEHTEYSELIETAPIETTLYDADDNELNSASSVNSNHESEFVSIRFRTVITELGFLEIWCEEISGNRRWKLEFSVREE